MIAAFHGFSLLVKCAIVGGALLAFFGTVAVYNESQRMKGEARVIERSQKQGKKINEKNETVRRRAAEPGAFERLLEHDCRDCR